LWHGYWLQAEAPAEGNASTAGRISAGNAATVITVNAAVENGGREGNREGGRDNNGRRDRRDRNNGEQGEGRSENGSRRERRNRTNGERGESFSRDGNREAAEKAPGRRPG
jgi:hypothetical protein